MLFGDTKYLFCWAMSTESKWIGSREGGGGWVKGRVGRDGGKGEWKGGRSKGGGENGKISPNLISFRAGDRVLNIHRLSKSSQE